MKIQVTESEVLDLESLNLKQKEERNFKNL